jgi:hypothetical protein
MMRSDREQFSFTVETLLIGNIVDQQNSHSSSIISSGNCAETLLS